MIWKTYGRCGWNEHVVSLPWDFGGRSLNESLSPECLSQTILLRCLFLIGYKGAHHHLYLMNLPWPTTTPTIMWYWPSSTLLCTQYLPHSYRGLVGLMRTTGCGRVGHNDHLVCTAHHLRWHWCVVSSFDMSAMNVDCSKWSSWHGWYRICVALLRAVTGFLASIT